ncbi:MAG: lysophospholipid acyltransferase family protein [Prevotellaceae bacterium]|jgi:KDO2-lipid IV(A) lauroyltransferase|nr:lysophospholipid acyltransferase family protein [Prevotellaceae bacterium]
MSTLCYWLLLAVVYPLACLPGRVLFAFSDVLYFMIYHVFGYRKSVVYTNLARSFPEKNYGEIKDIAKRFYRYFTDLYIETLRTLCFSRAKMDRMVHVANLERLEHYMRQHRSVVMVTAHYGNWEYFLKISLHFPLKVAYKPQSVRAIDRLMTRLRLHYNKSAIIPMQNMARYMLQHKKETYNYLFIADQSPSPQSKCWMRFLNQDTLFFGGAGKLAQALDLPVLYAEMQRTTRGHYRLTFTTVCEHAAQLPEQEITRRCAELMEQSIVREPAFWLWTHKRWKRKRNTEA